jgi:8-oxo-dGTP pyrophosphatase MutT (NUDIX family)
MWPRLGRSLYLVLQPGLWLVGRFGKARTRVIVKDKDGHILAVKTWLGSQHWSMPGGGIKPGETPLSAVIREAHEETGLMLEDIHPVGYFPKVPGVFFKVHIFWCELEQTRPALRPRGPEIMAAAWLTPEHIPKGARLLRFGLEKLAELQR